MIRLAGIERNSCVDGEGLRYTIFTQGCNHNCLGCQNPETHDFNGGYEEDELNIINEILEDPLLDGITLSGGDPLFQADKLLKIVETVKNKGLTIWLYTGFIFEDFLHFKNNEYCDNRITNDMIKLLELVDVVVDGPFVLSKRNLTGRFKGSDNQRLINVIETFKHNKIIEYRLEE